MKIIVVLFLLVGVGSSCFGRELTNQSGANVYVYNTTGQNVVLFGTVEEGQTITLANDQTYVVYDDFERAYSVESGPFDLTVDVSFNFTLSAGGGETGGGGSGSSAPLDLAAAASNIVGWLGLAAAAGVALFAAIYVLRLLIRSFQALK